MFKDTIRPRTVLVATLVIGSIAVLTGAIMNDTAPTKPPEKIIEIETVRDGGRAETEDDEDLVYAAVRAPYQGEPWFEQSLERNAELVLGKQVRLRFDQKKRDHKKRLLAYVFVDDKMVNETLAREGLAYVRLTDHNRRFAAQLLDAQSKARREQRGIWSQSPPDSADEYLGDPKYGNMHRPGCDELSKISADRIAHHATRDAALDAGLAPCPKCHP